MVELEEAIQSARKAVDATPDNQTTRQIEQEREIILVTICFIEALARGT
jgi:hypothetical protein